MSLFKRREEDLPELDERLERMKIQDEIKSKEADIAEKEAVISQLKKQYGPNWAKRLGVGKLTDLTTLRSFLRGAKQGLQKQYTGAAPALNPGNFRGIRRA